MPAPSFSLAFPSSLALLITDRNQETSREYAIHFQDRPAQCPGPPPACNILPVCTLLGLGKSISIRCCRYPALARVPGSRYRLTNDGGNGAHFQYTPPPELGRAAIVDAAMALLPPTTKWGIWGHSAGSFTALAHSTKFALGRLLCAPGFRGYQGADSILGRVQQVLRREPRRLAPRAARQRRGGEEVTRFEHELQNKLASCKARYELQNAAHPLTPCAPASEASGRVSKSEDEGRGGSMAASGRELKRTCPHSLPLLFTPRL